MTGKAVVRAIGIGVIVLWAAIILFALLTWMNPPHVIVSV
jgi:hypothetical protein